jgi:uncharacterized protein YebE (UPF0316 family)
MQGFRGGFVAPVRDMTWYLPFLIFLARICDVSIGTVRIVVVMRGHKMAAAILGFFEVAIWVLAVSAVLTHIKESIWTIIGYASGYAVGTLVGMIIEEKMALGHQIIRVVNTDAKLRIADYLREKGFGVTQVQAVGMKGDHELCFIVAPRWKTKELVKLIHEHSAQTFVTVEDIRSMSAGPGSGGGTGAFMFAPSEVSFWRRLTKFK